MKKLIILLVCSILWIDNALSQAERDLLLFSRYYATGTARSLSMSGAFGALGGDMSTLSTNPAGLGVYRGSEFTFTPVWGITSSNARLDGLTFKESDIQFKISNIGYVHTWNLNKETGGVQSWTFGVTYNRLSDFSSDAYVDSRVGSSMLDEFTWNANGGGTGVPLLPKELDNFYEGVAFDSKVIWDDNTGHYINDYDDPVNNFHDQALKRTISYRGGIGEYAFSLGTNINNKVYIGATWGIHDVSYKESFSHTEVPKFAVLEYFNFNSDYLINGWGMNFKAGVIYRPINLLRLGLSIHTPTRYRLQSELTTDMGAYYYTPPITTSDDDYYWAESPRGEKKFDVRTPWRYNASAAVILGEIGLIGLDAEYVDYSTALFLPNSDYREITDKAALVHRNAFNLKAGTEFRAGPASFRAGIAHYGTPFENQYFENQEFKNKGTLSYSGGVGFKTGGIYLDLAYVYTKYPKQFYDMYYNPLSNQWVSPVLQNINHQIAVTVGLKF
jgi:hypothetical protein